MDTDTGHSKEWISLRVLTLLEPNVPLLLQSRDDVVQDVECLGVSPEHHAASHHVHAEDGDDHEDGNEEDEEDYD